MKYDILVQTFTSSLVRKQYLPKKIAFFSPKIGEKKICQNPFQAIKRLKKMDHKAIGVGRVKPQWSDHQKKTFFMCVFPNLHRITVKRKTAVFFKYSSTAA